MQAELLISIQEIKPLTRGINIQCMVGMQIYPSIRFICEWNGDTFNFPFVCRKEH